MSKLSFRARALDATKPLPVYHADDIPDLSEYNTINRTVPQMPTGMEKEEEGERHLQEVILAQQTNSVKKKHVFIPTPDAAITVPEYEEIAKPIQRTSHYIRVPGLGLDEEVPDYDLDSEDDEWLSAQTNERPLSPTHFERMMDKLEKGSGNTVLSEKEAQLLLRDDEDLVLAVYDYWLAKRLRLGRSLIPTVRNISKDGTTSSGNPYLAFRKRMEKMQTRKNRKNDETAYMQMLKLKRDLEKALSLAELVKDRESKKHALAQNQMNVFKKRYILEDWSGSVMSSLRPVATRSASSKQSSTVSDEQWNSRTVLIKVGSQDDDYVHRVGRHEVLMSSGLKKKRKRKYFYPDAVPETPTVPPTPDKDSSRELLSEKLEDDEPDGIFTFKRKPHVKYHHSRYPIGLWPWQLHHEPSPLAVEEERSLSRTQSKRYRFSRVTLGSQSLDGLTRRRVGRGGRVMWDRVWSPNDSKLDGQDDVLSKEKQVHTQGTLQGTPALSSTPVAAAGLSHQDSVDKRGAAGTEKEEGNASANQQIHRLHFEARSPSPSSKPDFPPLPLIELTDRKSPPTVIPFGTAPGNYQPIDAGEFRLGCFASSSDGREEAQSFSSLPTSQFVLKPSTLDAGWSDHQHALFMQRPAGLDATLEPYSWSWLRNSRLSQLQLGNIRRTTSDPSISGGVGGGSVNYPHSSSSAPGNYQQTSSSVGGGGSAAAPGPGLSRQVSGSVVAPLPAVVSTGEQRDISRSSLSVASSKTIILSNAPVSHPHPSHLPPTGHAPMANAVNNASKTAAATLATPTDTPTPKGVVSSRPSVPTPQQAPPTQQQVSTQRSVGGTSKAASNALPPTQPKSDPPLTTTPQQISGGQPPTKTMGREKQERTTESKKLLTLSKLDEAATAGSGDSSVSNRIPDQNSAESAVGQAPPTHNVASKEDPSVKSTLDTTGNAEPMDTTPSDATKVAELTPPPPKVENSKTSSDSKTPSATKKQDGDKVKKDLGAWMVNKPSATILQLSRPRKREREERESSEDSPKTKQKRTLYATAEAALLVTSQFARQPVKKEETTSLQPLTVTHALNSAVVGMGARNALATAAVTAPGGALPMTSSSLPLGETNAVHIAHSTAKIPLPVATTPTLSVAQNAAKLLSLDSVQSLHHHQLQPQQQQQVQAQAVVNSVQDGVTHLTAAPLGQDKKTVVNAVSASGQAQALPGNLAGRRASTGTNGTNSYLHTERMKQALAGMNHNSLLESTKSALVPMNKSSKVT